MTRATYRLPERQKEWITLSGGDICLWALTMEEFSRIHDYSLRPPIDPRGGVDNKEAALWQIALSCYDGDGTDAERLWPDERVSEIKAMPAHDFSDLMVAINRLNGRDATTEEVMRDFTGETGANGSPSPSGVSATSTGSPKRLTLASR